VRSETDPAIMPAGIPDAAALLASLQSQIYVGIDFLQIPSVGLVRENFLVAYADVLKLPARPTLSRKSLPNRCLS